MGLIYYEEDIFKFNPYIHGNIRVLPAYKTG
jgi:hypothetical protein